MVIQIGLQWGRLIQGRRILADIVIGFIELGLKANKETKVTKDTKQKRLHIFDKRSHLILKMEI